MTMSTTTYLQFAQLIDSAIPIGGFSHSFGLESFVQVQKVTTKQQLQHYIEGQLISSLIPFDGNQIKQLYILLEEQNYDEVLLINQLSIAQRLARESREATCKMGKRLLKLGIALFPEANLQRLEQKLQKSNCSYPIVFAWICYHLHIPLQLCVHGFLYTSIQGYINSGLRLISLGQTDGQYLIHELQQFSAEQWLYHEQQQLNEAYSFSFVQDILAMEHEQLYSRLFMS